MTTYDPIEMGLLKNQAPLSGVDDAKPGNVQTRLTDNDGGFEDRIEATRYVHNQDRVIGNDGPYPGTETSRIAATSLQIDSPSGPSHSRRRTLLKLLSLWVGTIVFTALVVMLVIVYRRTGVITPAQKNTYNLASVVLILTLGLSFFEAFKALARVMSGKIKHLIGPQGEEEELIDHFDSLLKVTKLIGVTSTWRLRLFCIAWLSVIFAAQMLSALISLEVTIEDGNNYNTTYTTEGKVQVSNLTCYDPKADCPGSVQEHVLAHTYGEAILGSSCGPYTELADVIGSQQDYYYYCRRDPGRQEFAYRFSEYNSNDTQKAYPQFTSRVITAASGICTEHEQIENLTATLGGESAKHFTYTNPTNGHNGIRIPTSFLGDYGTTYIYRDLGTPDTATTWACGDRCLLMWAYSNYASDEGPRFYECPITISEVSNSGQPEHNVSHFVARLAAASIALQGRTHGTWPNLDWEQFQFYASGSLWDIHGYSAERAGANIAEFAIGSLATMVPNLGSKLSINAVGFGALLACIVAVHGVVFGLTYWLSEA